MLTKFAITNVRISAAITKIARPKFEVIAAVQDSLSSAPLSKSFKVSSCKTRSADYLHAKAEVVCSQTLR